MNGPFSMAMLNNQRISGLIYYSLSMQGSSRKRLVSCWSPLHVLLLLSLPNYIGKAPENRNLEVLGNSGFQGLILILPQGHSNKMFISHPNITQVQPCATYINFNPFISKKNTADHHINNDLVLPLQKLSKHLPSSKPL